ncbi:protein ALTERED XYLOGLUCAN 4-like isoform X1 [Ipomoea triloba]|uniref:protein ALTERED XYLOGLUCAN 4-like isoform X1 n=1 Tax=Ipomoea triloba TaxID=35885 RepID=UPI00125DB660|nr:protein ALTERED XYLOGLUCAN 4-like isoform X1 [Ipomoea triloba]
MDTSHTTTNLPICLVKTEKLFGMGSTGFLCFYSLFFSLIFSFYIFSSSTPHKFTPIQDNADTPSNAYSQRLQTVDNESCDLFDGEWVEEKEGPLYSNLSCPTIPLSKNCFYHGRKDRDFVYWRWKPEGCELPRFNPKAFLSIVKGKTMAFIGDSLARNHMESLLCLLYMEETPRNVYEDVEDKFRTWHFPHHNFTLMVLRSEFLIHATHRLINGSFTGGFDLHLDQLDSNWTQNLPIIDYAIFSDAHWFLRPNYLYEGGNLVGCIYCGDPTVKDVGPGFAIRRAFQAALNYVNENRNGVVVFLRTFSPAQFENGAWNKGGFCNRTRGFTKEEVSVGGDDWEFRKIQVEEIERARRYGGKRGNRFGIIDVTRAMLMRPDGHPGEFWGNKWMKGYSDCIHWCLPGPIDTWSELLLQMLHNTSALNQS